MLQSEHLGVAKWIEINKIHTYAAHKWFTADLKAYTDLKWRNRKRYFMKIETEKAVVEIHYTK